MDDVMHDAFNENVGVAAFKISLVMGLGMELRRRRYSRRNSALIFVALPRRKMF